MGKGIVVVGGGIVGVSTAYWLAQKGFAVTLLDQYETPNRWAASGDHLRVFRLTYGKDSFYTDMAAKALPLWLDFGVQSGETLLVQNGVLDLATKAHGYEEQSFQVLKEMKIPVERLDKEQIKRHYPMFNSRALSFGILHRSGGMLWANRATQAIAGLAQRKGVKARPHTAAVSVIKDKNGIRAVKDSNGKIWEGEKFVFATGYWTPQLLSSFHLPLKITRQEQLHLRPPLNAGRYRPEHFPVFLIMSAGFYGFPLHIHGFLKIADHRKGPVEKPQAKALAQPSPSVERKSRAFLKRFIPDLANFTESEGSVCYYDNTKDNDFIMDQLPGAPNAWVACGFSGHGFKFGPVLGQIMADLVIGAKPVVNTHRFRLSRFKR